MAKKLGEYKRKRDFEETPEPAGGNGDSAAQPGGRFVVHEHHARSLHWDLRLERDGVLASWAVPKGIPPDPKTNHLAVHVEDHPLEYIDFNGEIPEGNYGAGQVKIWDQGTYDVLKWRDDEVMVVFHGERLRGKYVLFQTNGKNWMIHRMDPPAEDREPMPRDIKPMMAKLSELPAKEDDWGFEIKWDGIRAIAYVEGGRVRLQNRNMRDVTRQYPELRELGRAVGTRELVLDGEIVAFDEQGRPSFGRLQHRMHLASESAVRRRMNDTPVVYAIFDVLYLDGRVTMQLPYEERRALLDELELRGPNWQTPSWHRGEGKALLDAAKEQDLEGIIAKRLGSPYEPGRRSGCWRKVKAVQRQELVVGGYMPGEGGRTGRVGSLCVGYYDKTRAEAEKRGEEQRLIYAGNVGTGFKEADLVLLGKLLEPLRRKDSPFAGRQPKKGAVFVEPQLVVEVEFLQWTRTNTLRAPSFKGLRDDKDPRDVVIEKPEPA
ncbi:MAG: non-homologous end-joining DNA ligase [Thermoleophilaceae bacterium]